MQIFQDKTDTKLLFKRITKQINIEIAQKLTQFSTQDDSQKTRAAVDELCEVMESAMKICFMVILKTQELPMYQSYKQLQPLRTKNTLVKKETLKGKSKQE